MIQWSLTLSESQIALLKAMAEWDKVKGKLSEDELLRVSPFGAFSHFITHSRLLLREGLVRHREPASKPSTAAERTHSWSVTPKGMHILAVVEIEVAEMRGRHLLGDGLPVGNGEYGALAAEVEAAKAARGKPFNKMVAARRNGKGKL